MARVTRGRVIRGEAPLPRPQPSVAPATRQRIAREEMEAREAASRILAEASAEAERIVAEAKGKAEGAVAAAVAEAEAREQAKLAATYLALRGREEQQAEADLARAVELARVLAERMIGEAIQLDGAVVTRLARQALGEARGARTVRIEAHPQDAAALQATTSLLPAELGVTIVHSTSLARGSLRLHTDLGTLDAQLRPQLERLARALQDVLRSA